MIVDVMTALFPTRVSLYDFLFEDTLPIDAVFADIGHLSIPQARVIIENGIQAIISALLAYNQRYGGEAVLKKLLNRNPVKELRTYNAFNLNTMKAAFQNGSSIIDVLFDSTENQTLVCQKLAQQAHLPLSEVRSLLGALNLLCLREIAILTDYAHLDEQEIEIWFALQPQFFELSRPLNFPINDGKNTTNKAMIMPHFDSRWHEITGYQPPVLTSSEGSEQLPHYAKVIGRTSSISLENQSWATGSSQLIVDTDNNREVLTFASMPHISLPYQRWLLQLAKISDIYLSRKRLKVASEPTKPPSRPFVNFGFLETNSKDNNQDAPNKDIEHHSPTPIWRSPVIILLILVIGGLSLMAVGKYHYKKAKITPPISQSK